MKRFQFDKIETMLIDPDTGSRDTLRMVLKNNGFREFRLGTTLADVTEQFAVRMPDLLICEADLADGEFSEFLHGMRHQVVGTNPFLPVMALSYNPTPELVKSIIGSGADDLVPKPVSAGRLIDRIKLLIEARKPFVVTTDYVGPDRRKTSDREDTIPRVEVPSPLRAKATGTKDIALDQKAMADAIAQINLRKLERYAVQIGVLTELIVPAYESGTFDQSVKDHVDQLKFVAEDTSRRLVGTKYLYISELCDTLLSVVESIAASGGAAQAKDLKLLPNIAKAIEKTFDVKEDTEAIARKISASVRNK